MKNSSITNQIAREAFRQSLESLPQGGSVMGSCWYPAAQNIEGFSIQRGPAHYLVDETLYMRGAYKPETIKKGLDVAQRYIKLIKAKEPLFEPESIYEAVINYGDPYKMGGFSEKFSGTPSQIKQKAMYYEDGMWHSMNCNGNPYVSIEINGLSYNRNLKTAINMAVSVGQALEMLHKDIVSLYDVTSIISESNYYSRSILLGLVQVDSALPLVEAKKSFKWYNSDWQLKCPLVVWYTSTDLRESWSGLTLN